MTERNVYRIGRSPLLERFLRLETEQVLCAVRDGAFGRATTFTWRQPLPHRFISPADDDFVQALDTEEHLYRFISMCCRWRFTNETVFVLDRRFLIGAIACGRQFDLGDLIIEP